MKTFIKCASVLRIALTRSSRKERRRKVCETLEEYVRIHEPYGNLEYCFV
jgi:hypothetical protein